ncbi:hypothetical protein SAY87_000470 [Trapa incisa]|uniref:K+ potassium transporter integral membrane domain-containing protein n=1 Tax=Trapa incisa TaxID=236973 RepID=A0AAN7GRN9_9MYRT|nr:hypothetical protein SAY87_000470 [Trapa incisa]
MLIITDLSHFPDPAIQISFTVIVYPTLLLAYSGQAAYLLENPDHVVDAFYRSIPGNLLLLYSFVILFCSLSLKIHRFVEGNIIDIGEAIRLWLMNC